MITQYNAENYFKALSCNLLFLCKVCYGWLDTMWLLSRKLSDSSSKLPYILDFLLLKRRISSKNDSENTHLMQNKCSKQDHMVFQQKKIHIIFFFWRRNLTLFWSGQRILAYITAYSWTVCLRYTTSNIPRLTWTARNRFSIGASECGQIMR